MKKRPTTPHGYNLAETRPKNLRVQIAREWAEPQTKEAYRRKVSPQDIQALQERAAAWANIGGPGRQGIQRQALAAYELHLDFLRHSIGGDFPRWLSRHSGVPRTTCQYRLKAGTALAAGSKTNRNQSGLMQEQREREQTSGPEINWEED